MGRVPLAILKPTHGTAVDAGAVLALRGEAAAPAGTALQYRWWSTLPLEPTEPPRPDPGVPPDLDLVAIATGLQADVRLTPGSHVLTLSAKDQVRDDPEALRQVETAGTTGGAPPRAEAPCVVHVAGAVLLLPADRRVSRAVGAAAVAPPLWAEPDYQTLNELRYRWTFRPAGGGPDVVVDPEPDALVFAPHTEQPRPFLPPPPLPPRVSTGPLGVGLGAHTLVLTVTALGASAETSAPITVVA